MKKSILTLVVFMVTAFSMNAQKFAFIDMEYILENIPEYNKANDQIEQTTKKRQSEIKDLGEQVKEMFKEYQKILPQLSKEERLKREDAIVDKEKDIATLKNKYFGPKGELMQMRDKLIMPIQNNIYEAVKKISEYYGYDAVIDRASANSVIFASPKIDISNDVLTTLGYSN